jgi:predicted aconitase with swiveling domain
MTIQLHSLLVPSNTAPVTGQALHVVDPISFWGGVSPTDGTLSDPRSRHHGRCISGTVMIIRELRGSSSGSSILLELIYRRLAPAAIVLTAPDAILALGVLVAREMQWSAPSLFQLAMTEQPLLPEGAELSIGPEGCVSILKA